MVTQILKQKEQKKCLIKRMLNYYKSCLLDSKIVLESQKIFKSEAHNAYTEKKIKKLQLNSNDGKRLQTFDRFTSYRYGTSVGRVCKAEIRSNYK